MGVTQFQIKKQSERKLRIKIRLGYASLEDTFHMKRMGMLIKNFEQNHYMGYQWTWLGFFFIPMRYQFILKQHIN